MANRSTNLSKPCEFHWFWFGIFGKNANANFLVVPIVLLFSLFSVAVIRSPNLVSSAGLGSALIVVAPLILASYALTLIAMAGRGGVDLSIGPLIGFINVTLIVLFERGYLTSWAGFFIYAIAVGMLYQFILAIIIIFVRIQPIIVSLSGFLTLSGLNLIILRRPGGTVPEWMQWWGEGINIWTPALAILVVMTLFWFFLKKTAFFMHLHMMGADERTAYTAGVNINIVRLITHLMAGVCAALAAISFTALIGSGDPTQGSTYTLIAVTAMVLGGTSLAGGRGTIVGSLLGAVNIYLINYVLSTFNFGKVQSYVIQLSYGGILVLALMLTLFLPNIQKIMKHISPVLLFIFLGLVACGVVLFSFDSQKVKSFSTVSERNSGIQSLSASEDTPKETSSKSTSLIVGLVIIAVIFFLFYLLYRFFSLAIFLLIGAIGLLTIGYGVYDSPENIIRVQRTFVDFYGIFSFVENESLFATETMDMRLIAIGLTILGSLLLGTCLSLMTIKKTTTSISNKSVLLIIFVGLMITGLITYGSESFNREKTEDYGNFLLGLLTVGGLMFALTMSKFSRQLPKISETILGLFGIILLSSLLWGGVNSELTQTISGIQQVKSAMPVSVSLETVQFSPLFVSITIWLLVLASILFLLTIEGVRNFLNRNIAFNKLPIEGTYTIIFIAAVSGGLSGWMFFTVDVPLWKFIIATIAAIIGAWIFSHFLKNYRKRQVDESIRTKKTL